MNNYPFSEPVRAALRAAQEEAAGLYHEYIGTEHLLLAVDRDPSVRALLERLGVTSQDLHAGVEAAVRRGRVPPTSRALPYTSRARKVLEFSLAEAQESGDPEIQPRHLLLALIRESRGIACEILRLLGVTTDRIHSDRSHQA